MYHVVESLTQEKILEEHTTRKNRKTYRAAQTAANNGFLTGFVPHADNTKGKPLEKPVKIGVDIMGSDNAPHVLLNSLKKLTLPKGVELVIFASPSLEKEVAPFSFEKAEEVIEMDEHPLHALREKKRASTLKGLRLLKEKKIEAFISLGNTGALVSASKIILSMIKGINRPALLTLMPTKKSPVAVLDVGANIEAKAKNLIEFAKMGVAFQKTRGLKDPKVGLLNIGSEALKGTSELKVAYHKMQNETSFSFEGNIEGKTVFDGDVDVLVTDGFTGNVFLKTAEGIASLILDRVEKESSDMKRFESLHHAEYPGALLVGVQGVVIKCHGYSTPKGVCNAVLKAIEWAQEMLVQKIENQLK